MIRLTLPLVFALAAASSPQEPAPPAKPTGEPAAAADSNDPEARRVAKAREAVETFFAATFPREFAVVIAADRKEFDAYLAKEYGWPDSQCWMVATGTAKGIAILDPAVWKTDACEHDGTNEAHVQGIVTHELVHVFHGQKNPTGDFEGMDDLGWFVEGLAVHVSGQLDAEHRNKDREAIEKGAAPAALKDAWSGKWRYAVCGSLVRYLDETHGRAKLVELLAATTPERFHDLLGASESELLEGWKKWVAARDRKSPPRSGP